METLHFVIVILAYLIVAANMVDSVLFSELTRFSRIGDTQYFIYSSSAAWSTNKKIDKTMPEVVSQHCERGVLEGKVCKEVIDKTSSGACPRDATVIEDKCIRFHSPKCPTDYKDIDGKCMIDAGCDPKLYDQVGTKCYEKCQASYRRYYSNLCITEEKSCPIQFRRNGTQCILAECPIGMTMSDDQVHCEMKCPKFFSKMNETTCRSLSNICPMNYEKEGYQCVLSKCSPGLLMYGVCLDTICHSGYTLENNVCQKCLTSTHSFCSAMDWKCPMGLIEIGSGPHMKCVMICPRNYAQFGKHCMDISVTSCPEKQYHYMGNQCINEDQCPKGYEIFGKECVKKTEVSTFVLNGRLKTLCPPNYIEFNDECLKLTNNKCPSKMLRIEESLYCVESCPGEFYKIHETCISSTLCSTNQYSFMGQCFDKCPTGTAASNSTRSCQVLNQCEDDKIFDLTRFRCINPIDCSGGYFISPDSKFCHKKDQCNGQGYILDQYCVNACPVDYEVDTQFCKQKPRVCPSLSLTNGECVTECPEGHIPNNRVCILVKVEKKNLICGVNKELQQCSQNSTNCMSQCVCKTGYVEDPKGDYCVPKQITCHYSHQLDLVFLIDGSNSVSGEMFNDIKFFIMETVTNAYTSKLDVRTAIYVYGQSDPQLVMLYETKHLCHVMQKISHLIQSNFTQTFTSLVDSFRVTRNIIMSQCNGARIGSTRQLFVIGEFSEFENESTKQNIMDEIELSQKSGYRIAFISINRKLEIAQSVYRFSVTSTKDLSKIQNEIYGITCKDFTCAKGYMKVVDKCEDVNECDSNKCHETSQCINVPGSYVCYCPNELVYLGVELGCGKDKSTECTKERNATNICDAVKCTAPANCSSTNGMAFCVCPKGFKYSADSGCMDVNECQYSPCLGNIGTCRNSYGSFDCFCPKGFKYNLHFGCIDVDECTNADACSGNGICRNTVGSYECACHPGFQYVLDNGCIDIDECNQTQNLCQGDKVMCRNTPGSFKCVCPRGYEYKETGCVDINECMTNNTCPEGSLCKNKIGGYKCSCAKGFIYDNGTNTCELDKSLNVIKPKADMVFGVDVSKPMENYIDSVINMLKNIITDYKLKSLATIKHYFALTIGQNSDVVEIFKEETDTNVLNRTSEIKYRGGEALLSIGLKASRELYEKYGQTNSSKLVIFTTARKPNTIKDEEVMAIKNEISQIKKDARLLIIYIGENVQSEEWKVMFKESEIEEHVIAVSSDFITTIHKVIYQKTDRLIKCPEGFVFLDKVCQYRTSKALYCKWDNKLYALNSTWTSSCALYNCTEEGVVVLNTMCMGFDGDCYKENEFFPCNLNGKLNWRCKCRIAEYFEEETKKNQQRIDYIIINFDKNATIARTKLEDNGNCVLPFKYRNQWNYACTEHNSIKRWCSWNMYYVQSEYSYCARQVTSQCIFEGETYKEGDKWNVGCNLVTCSTGMPYVTARCSTLNDTCVPLNADNYPCKVKGDVYRSCMCLQDNFGYGENTPIEGKVSQKKNNSNSGGLLEYCEHRGTGKQYQVGETWIIDCFKLKCLKNGITKIEEKQCISSDGSCIATGSPTKFQCHIGDRMRDNCECVLENDELVLLANEGGKAERKVVGNKAVIDL